jgi:hypothetical protein
VFLNSYARTKPALEWFLVVFVIKQECKGQFYENETTDAHR